MRDTDALAARVGAAARPLRDAADLDPLHLPVLVDGEVPETYPTGM